MSEIERVETDGVCTRMTIHRPCSIEITDCLNFADPFVCLIIGTKPELKLYLSPAIAAKAHQLLADALGIAEPCKAALDLLKACKAASKFYDRLAIETSPLDCAVKHGPDYEPPTREEWDEMCLEMRRELKVAIAKAEPDSAQEAPGTKPG